MGMFDTIRWPAPCPMCNQPVEWQTKQGPQALSTMTADQLADDVITNGDGSEDWVHWHYRNEANAALAALEAMEAEQ